MSTSGDIRGKRRRGEGEGAAVGGVSSTGSRAAEGVSRRIVREKARPHSDGRPSRRTWPHRSRSRSRSSSSESSSSTASSHDHSRKRSRQEWKERGSSSWGALGASSEGTKAADEEREDEEAAEGGEGKRKRCKDYDGWYRGLDYFFIEGKFLFLQRRGSVCWEISVRSIMGWTLSSLETTSPTPILPRRRWSVSLLLLLPSQVWTQSQVIYTITIKILREKFCLVTQQKGIQNFWIHSLAQFDIPDVSICFSCCAIMCGVELVCECPVVFQRLRMCCCSVVQIYPAFWSRQPVTRAEPPPQVSYQYHLPQTTRLKVFTYQQGFGKFQFHSPISVILRELLTCEKVDIMPLKRLVLW